MGIFFTSSQPLLPIIATELQNAFVTTLTADAAQHEAARKTIELAKAVEPKFNVDRFVGALVISVALLIAAIWTGRHDLPDISKGLMDAFSGYNGIIVGLLGGEAQKSSAG